MDKEFKELSERLEKLENRIGLTGNYLSTKEAASLLGYTLGTLYVKVHRTEIPHTKAAGSNKLVFKKSELIKYLESGRVINMK